MDEFRWVRLKSARTKIDKWYCCWTHSGPLYRNKRRRTRAVRRILDQIDREMFKEEWE